MVCSWKPDKPGYSCLHDHNSIQVCDGLCADVLIPDHYFWITSTTENEHSWTSGCLNPAAFIILLDLVSPSDHRWWKTKATTHFMIFPATSDLPCQAVDHHLPADILHYWLTTMQLELRRHLQTWQKFVRNLVQVFSCHSILVSTSSIFRFLKPRIMAYAGFCSMVFTNLFYGNTETFLTVAVFLY